MKAAVDILNYHSTRRIPWFCCNLPCQELRLTFKAPHSFINSREGPQGRFHCSPFPSPLLRCRNPRGHCKAAPTTCCRCPNPGVRLRSQRSPFLALKGARGFQKSSALSLYSLFNILGREPRGWCWGDLSGRCGPLLPPPPPQ